MSKEERPLSNTPDETRRKLASQDIIDGWSQISLRLRVCLAILGAVNNPFGLGGEDQIDKWSEALRLRLTGAADSKRQRTVAQLRNVLECRDTLCHGERQWGRDELGQPELRYILGVAKGKRPPKHLLGTLGEPFAVFGNAFLLPKDGMVRPYTLGALEAMAAGMPDLCRSVEALSESAIAKGKP